MIKLGSIYKGNETSFQPGREGHRLRKRKPVRGMFYRRSLFTLLIVSSIPGLLTALGIYWFGTGAIGQALKALHSEQMEQRLKSIDDMFVYLELGISQRAVEPWLGPYLREVDFTSQKDASRNLIKTLNVIRDSHPLIDEVQLYLKQENGTYLFDPNQMVELDLKSSEPFEQLLAKSEPMVWTTKPIMLRGASHEGPHRIDPVLKLSHLLPGDGPEAFGVLAVTINTERLADMMITLTPYNDGNVFLLNENRQPILSTVDGVAAEVFERSLREDITKRGGESGSFVKVWKGETYSVTYGTLERLSNHWIYVAAAPTSAITAPVVLVSQIIFGISAVMLLSALILSWLASRRIYSPLERVVRVLTGNQPAKLQVHGLDEFQLLEKEWSHLERESKLLQHRLEEELPHMKEVFMLQLVQGKLATYSERDLRERMKQYGWQISGQQFTFIRVQLTGFARLNGRFLDSDEGLVTFAAANIIQELSQQYLPQVNVLNFHNLSVGLVVIAPLEVPHRDRIYALSDAITDAINRILKLKVTIIMSRPTLQVQSLPELYAEVNQAVGFRLFADENQLIDLDERWPESRVEGQDYPFALDREIVQAIRLGDLDGSERLIDRFIEEVSRGIGQEYMVQQFVLQLYGSIQYVILQSGIKPHQLFKGMNMFERLSAIREPEQIANWFKSEVIRPYLQELEHRSNRHLKHAVEQTIQYIEQRYMEDISLESCARMTGTTHYALSRAFKQQTGINFVDYLNRYRVEKAKEMLRATNLKINDIAEKIGYQHSYFNRIFKKYEGITPSQYRDKWSAV